MKKTLIGLLGSTVICVLFLAGCICKSRTTCDGEEVEEHVHYFRYDFITPNNRYLLQDYCYWQIDRISSSVLSIYETFENPVVVMGQTREYKSFSAVPLGDD